MRIANRDDATTRDTDWCRHTGPGRTRPGPDGGKEAAIARAAPSVIAVITADDIRATGATNLADVLQSVPGIHVQYSHFGYRPLVRFRGANDKQTLLMVDGAPMSDLMWRLGIFWKGLPASVIDRVEIIRGPGSTPILGASALHESAMFLQNLLRLGPRPVNRIDTAVDELLHQIARFRDAVENPSPG